ncbi:MAG: hypothetical protein SF187_26810 [Deltaproteobacteria bacterium]|nr:hypothetical protein [Deltaproteobacteria bacterium]
MPVTSVPDAAIGDVASSAGGGAGMAPKGGVAGVMGGGGLGGVLDAGGMAGTPIPPDPKPVLSGENLNCSVVATVADADLAKFENDLKTSVTATRPTAMEIFVVTDGSKTGSHLVTHTRTDLACASAGSLNLTARGYTSWGVSLVMPFLARNSFYDASAFLGIQFLARGTRYLDGRVNVSDRNSSPVGGHCKSSLGECYNHWGRGWKITTEWRLYRLMFDELDQIGGNRFGPFDVHHVLGLEFAVVGQDSYDLQIDEIAFIPKTEVSPL